MSGLSNSLVQEYQIAMLVKEMDISKIMAYIKQIEEEKMRKRERDSKRAHFDEGRSSSTKTSEPKSKRERNPYLICEKCGRMHLGEYLIGQEGFFKCGVLGHKKRDCPVATRKGSESAQNALPGMYMFL